MKISRPHYIFFVTLFSRFFLGSRYYQLRCAPGRSVHYFRFSFLTSKSQKSVELINLRFSTKFVLKSPTGTRKVRQVAKCGLAREPFSTASRLHVTKLRDNMVKTGESLVERAAAIPTPPLPS